jgi:hypothetical protein
MERGSVMNRQAGALGVFAVGLCLVPLTACSASGPTVASSSTAAVTGNVFASVLGNAHAASVSDAQIVALEKAAKSGEMSYADVSALVEDMYRCFDAGGVQYLRDPDREPFPGFKVPSFGYADAQLAVADACQEKHAYYALYAYQNQPRAAELSDAALEAERPQVIACLRKNGVVVDDDATLDELRLASWDLIRTSDASPGGAVMCTHHMSRPGM